MVLVPQEASSRPATAALRKRRKFMLGSTLPGWQGAFNQKQAATIPEVQTLWRNRMREMLEDGAALDRTLLNYDPPAGNPHFREAFAAFLKRECGWDVTHENVCVLPSSQTACFLLFNLLAGEGAQGRKRILFPLVPEYIGYANQGLCEGMFTACLPRIEELGPHEFKYRVDFEKLRITPDIAGISISC